jgi:hypothetical protein
MGGGSARVTGRGAHTIAQQGRYIDRHWGRTDGVKKRRKKSGGGEKEENKKKKDKTKQGRHAHPASRVFTFGGAWAVKKTLREQEKKQKSKAKESTGKAPVRVALRDHSIPQRRPCWC